MEVELGVRRLACSAIAGPRMPEIRARPVAAIEPSCASASRAASCSAAFFELALADAELLAVDDRRAGEMPLVRRPLGREHDVGDLLARCARAPPGARSCGRRASSARTRCARRTRRRPRPRSPGSRARGRARRATASSSAASTLRFFASRSISSAWRSPLCAASRAPRSSSRATTAQLARETTCERIFASRPSEKSG